MTASMTLFTSHNTAFTKTPPFPPQIGGEGKILYIVNRYKSTFFSQEIAFSLSVQGIFKKYKKELSM